MAQPRFHVPGSDPQPRHYNGAPRPLPQCEWLIEKATGHIHPYHPGFAARSDLVDVYTGPIPPNGVRGEQEEQDAKPRVKKVKAKAEDTIAPPPPPPPPIFAEQE